MCLPGLPLLAGLAGQYADWSQAPTAQCGYRSRTPDGGAILWFSGFLNSWLTI